MPSDLARADGSPIVTLAPCPSCKGPWLSSYRRVVWCSACSWRGELTEELLARPVTVVNDVVLTPEMRRALSRSMARVGCTSVELPPAVASDHPADKDANFLGVPSRYDGLVRYDVELPPAKRAALLHVIEEQAHGRDLETIARSATERAEILEASLRAILEHVVDGKGYMTHRQQEILREARALVKS